ncbi:MAG: FlgD immunoglobulin-like domain containing protein, partial [bacterium]
CPNDHAVSFPMEFHDTNDTVWTATPSITVYAPVLTYQDVSIIGGNGNGILDPGETTDVVVTIENEGGATAANVTSTLWTSSSYITINDDSGNFGTINPGNQGNNSSDPYNVTANATTPTGTICDFEVEVVSGIYVDTLQFSLVVGKKHYYIWNPDPTPAPGADCHTRLGNLGYSGDYGTTLAPDLTLYQAVLVFVGIYSNNYIIASGSAEAAALVDFLQNQGGRMYLEGGDVWYWDPPTGYDFGPLFGINATADGSGNGGPFVGQASTFTTGMSFAYGGENSYIDHISPTGTGFLIFYDTDNAYDAGVANDAGTYRTVGTSFELGGLVDASPPSTRSALLDSIMKFFGIVINPGVEEGGLAGLPLKTLLGVMYPNPGLGVMSIRYQVAGVSDVSLCVYDAAGRLVRTIIKGACEPGCYTQVWDVRDDLGRRVPAGVYFVRFETDDYKKTEKAILLR